MFTLSVGLFYGQLVEQLNVALLSRPTVFLQCYSLLLLYFGQLNGNDGDNPIQIMSVRCVINAAISVVPWCHICY